MKKLNILSKTDGWSSGHTPVTLGTTVGSPSVHRRGTLLKLLSMLVLMVFGFGQMWATEVETTFVSGTSTTSGGQTLKCAEGGLDWVSSGKVNSFDSSNGRGYQFSAVSSDVTTTIANATITEVEVVASSNTAVNSMSVTVGSTSFTCGGETSVTITKTNNTTYTWTGSASGEIKVSFIAGTSGKSMYVKSIKVTYTSGGGGSKTLSSVAVSGTPTKTSYKAGQNFDPAGLTVTGHYSDNTDAPITSGITWSYNPSQTLSLNQTSIGVTATVNNIASDEVNVAVTVTAAPTYGLVTDDADLAENDEIIIVNTDANKAISTEQKTNNRAAVSVSASNYVITPGDDVQVLTLGKSNDNWTLYTGEGFLYASSSSNNNMNTQTTNDANGEWTISIAGDGTVTAIAQGANTRNEMRYNPNNGSPIFSCYASTSGMGKVKIFKKIDNSKPKAPTFSIAAGDYETAQSVELSCETTGATIYYTLDGTTPTNESTVYSTAIPVSATTTIKAIAIKDNISSGIASATYTIIVWQTVADVWNSITVDGPLNAHIYGYVSQTNVSGYPNNFYISDNGSTEGNQLYAYRMDMNSYSVEVGDKVKLAGDLTIHNETTKQFKYTSAEKCGKVIAKEAKGALQSVAVSGTPTKTEYAANETFDPAGLKVYGTYANGFVGEITDGITWGNDLTDGKVIESTTVHVTATVSEITSPAYDVPVTVAAKTLVSIAVGTSSYTIYTGEALPKPIVTATFSEGEPEDVSEFAVYDSESVFDTEVIDNPDPQTITVSYTFGGATQTATYTVSVKDYANADDAPYTVTEALHIITDAIGNAESAREIVVAGTVSAEKVSNYKNRYKISDGANELLVYNGKGFNDEAFTDANYPKVGDVMIVKGKVINFQGNTPEFASGKSYLLSQVRTGALSITEVTGFEVGTADMAVEDLTVTTESNGVVTLASSDNTAAVTIADGKLHAVAAGSATITANLAATSNEDALNYTAATTTFSVTVKAATVKYSITFNGNGADGGSAPADIENKAEGDPVTLPANTYTYTGHIFTGWEVTYVDGESVEHEVTVTANAFTMPAYNVTVKAQWEEISEWAYVYTSNVELEANSSTKCSSEGVTISSTEYSGLRIATGSAAGSATITVPAHANKLHFHVAGWKDVNGSIDVKLGESTLATISLIADDGINQLNNNKAPYTLVNDPIGYYSSVNIPDSESPTDIVFEAPSGKRAVIFGVNQVGGVLPVLDRIEISGDLNKKTGYKAGQALDMTGLTVNAIYKLNSEDQDPVDITEDVEWSYDALVENQTEVTVTATYSEKQAQKTITGLDPVASADPKIIIDNLNVNFGTVATNANVDDQTITVTLTNVASVTAELGGTNPEAFSISKTENIVSGDVITISFIGSTATAGSFAATIAISDGAEGAQDKTVNLSLKVEDVETAVSTTSEWVEATEVADGMEVLITGVKADVTYAVSEQGEKNRTTAAGTLSEGVFTPGANTMPFTLVAQEGENKYALRTSNGKYLYAASGSANQLKTRDAIGDDGKAVWTITIGAENVASIVANCETTSWHNTMQFNQNANNNPVVACYTSASQDDIKLYVPKPAPTVYIVTFDKNDGVSDVEEVEVNEGETVTKPEDPIREGYTFHYWTLNNAEYDFDTPVTGDITLVADWTENPAPDYGSYQRDQLTAGRYGTICLPNGGTIEGATLFDIDYYDGVSTLYLLEVNDNAMIAGRPYIFLPSATTITVTYTDDENKPEGGNYRGLYGSLAAANVEIPANVGNYILYNNAYYLVDVENTFVAPNRAYIKIGEEDGCVPTTPTQQGNGAPRRRIAMTVNGKQTPTGFDELNASEAPAKKVINGQLFILRGEKIYDATGRLVK